MFFLRHSKGTGCVLRAVLFAVLGKILPLASVSGVAQALSSAGTSGRIDQHCALINSRRGTGFELWVG
jgi:hypothetical protein